MKRKIFIVFLLMFVLAAASCVPQSPTQQVTVNVSAGDIPEYSGLPYIVVNGNVPYFTQTEITAASYEYYSELDVLGRCGVCVASISADTMPTEERKSISSVKPSGWQSVSYDNIEGGSLYNRCHLIGFQLTGENANERNLITGTRYMNVSGMLPFENMVTDYIHETNNHVMYRATPYFDGMNLVASGVLLEGYSVEDDGEGILFCVYCYNVQPGIVIDYSDGSSFAENPELDSAQPETLTDDYYILNTNTKKIHYPDCSSIKDTKEAYKEVTYLSVAELEIQGYMPCGRCKPSAY